MQNGADCVLKSGCDDEGQCIFGLKIGKATFYLEN